MRENSWIQDFIHDVLFCFGAVLIAIIIIPITFVIYPLWVMYEAFFGRDVGSATMTESNQNQPK